MTLYHLRHSTVYDYATPVVIGTHFMHLLPRNRLGQVVEKAQLEILPTPDNRRDEVDHFGNTTTSVSLTTPHKQFSVTLEAVVDVCQPPPPPADQTPAWEDIVASSPENPDIAEFCLPSRLAAPDQTILAYASLSLTPRRAILAAVMDLNTRIFNDMIYQPGVTNNLTTAAQFFKNRNGVCQDYAHLLLACLRAYNLPGRYVSGYLRTHPPEGQPRWRGADQSHAWISAWMGPQTGWIDFDPTNNLIVADEHVTLAWGRDFSDVSPLRGIILGGGRHNLSVSVDLEENFPA